MTASDDTETAALWAVGGGHQRPRLLAKSCALCAVPPASPLGLCRSHLEQAAAELARLAPRTAELDGRPSSVPVRALCARCGRPGHGIRNCDA
jgi:hypothetical protein